MATKELRVSNLLPIFIGLVVSLLFVSLLVVTLNKVNNNRLNKIYLNSIIKSNANKEGKRTYLRIKSISPKIASFKNNGYYIVSDGDYNYVVLLTDKKAEELISKDLENNPVTINGVSKEMSNKLKNIVLEKYNNGFEENERITLKDYYSYFGDVYLDQTLVLK